MLNNNLINILKYNKIKKTNIITIKKNNYKLSKLNYIYIISKVISKILKSNLEIKLDVRLVKDMRDNVNILGSYINKEVMKNPRSVKGVWYRVLSPIKKKTWKKRRFFKKINNNIRINKKTNILKNYRC